MSGELKLRVMKDDTERNSREDFDNVGVMVCWHSRYKLGDEQPKEDPTEYRESLPEGTVILPLYLYDHSGLTISTSGFSCPWDSGQVGFIYCTPEKMKEEGFNEENARNYMKGEVEVYDMDLRGDIYGFILEKDMGTCECCGRKNEPEEVASCWGFYGTNWKENGIGDHLPEEALHLLDENIEVEYGY